MGKTRVFPLEERGLGETPRGFPQAFSAAKPTKMQERAQSRLYVSQPLSSTERAQKLVSRANRVPSAQNSAKAKNTLLYSTTIDTLLQVRFCAFSINTQKTPRNQRSFCNNFQEFARVNPRKTRVFRQNPRRFHQNRPRYRSFRRIHRASRRLRQGIP